jgi:hypothetical protein
MKHGSCRLSITAVFAVILTQRFAADVLYGKLEMSHSIGIPVRGVQEKEVDVGKDTFVKVPLPVRHLTTL